MANPKIEDWLSGDNLIRLEAWARDGLTIEQLANNMQINPRTIYRWKENNESFCRIIKRNKEVADIIVENALYKRAIGYKYKEITREPVKNQDTGEYELKVTKEVTKEVVPDVTAQIYWLKNRKPAEWRDRRLPDNNDALEKLDNILEEVKKGADDVITETE